MFTRCYRCFRPTKNCLCSNINPIHTGIKFVFLMHPREAFHQKTGTGRLAALSLDDSEIIIGIDFTNNKRLNELLDSHGEGAAYKPFLLYPDSSAVFTDSPEFRTSIGDLKPLVILVDATWFFAKKMIRLSKNLHNLPKLSFKNEYRSQFQFKKQPELACLSTIETSFYLLEEFKTAGIVSRSVDPSGLITVFNQMVNHQLACEQARQLEEAKILNPELFNR